MARMCTMRVHNAKVTLIEDDGDKHESYGHANREDALTVAWIVRDIMEESGIAVNLNILN